MTSRKKTFAILALITASAMLHSCSKTETADLPDLKKSYFPLNPGHSITYQVDSAHYYFSVREVFSFQLKDTVISEVNSAPNTKTVYIERYKRKNDNAPWVFQKIITRSITDLRAEEFTGNQRFVRIVFPPEKNKTWNGNTYNNLEKQEYFFKNVDFKTSFNGISLDSVSHVVQVDDSNLLTENYAEEFYAKNIGLVKKHVKSVEKEFYSQRIEAGDIYTMTILSAK